MQHQQTSQCTSKEMETSEATQPGKPLTPKEQLAQLQKELEEDKVEVGAKTKFNEQVAKDIKELDQAWNEVVKIAEDYKRVHQTLEDTKAEYGEYSVTKMKMIEAAVKDQKPQIEQVIQEYDQEVTSAQNRWMTANSEYERAKTAYEVALANNEQAKQDFDEAKTYKQDIDTGFRKLKELRDWIEKADNENRPEIMYHLMKDFQKVYGLIEVEQDGVYKERLTTLWNQWSQTKNDLRMKQEEFHTSKELRDLIKKELDALVNNRRQRLVDLITNIDWAEQEGEQTGDGSKQTASLAMQVLQSPVGTGG